MMLLILNKILVTIFILSCLNIIRQGFFFIKALLRVNKENFQPFILSPKAIWLLGLSIGFVIMGIFTGITL